MDQQRILEIFVAESDELLAQLEQGLVALESQSGDEEIIHGIFRAAHTLKGNAGMTGVEAVVSFSHVMENVLDQLRSHTLEIDQDLTSYLLASVDALKEMTAAVAAGETAVLTDEHKGTLEKLSRYVSTHPAGKAAPKAAPAEPTIKSAAPKAQSLTPKKVSKAPEPVLPIKVFDIQMKFRTDILATGQDPALLIQELADLGELVQVEPLTKGLPSLELINPTNYYLGWHVVLRTESDMSALDGVFIFVKDENDIKVKDITTKFVQKRDFVEADKKLGELLVEEGCIKEDDIQQALQKQKRVGEILVEEGKVPSATLNKVLAKQQTARKVRQNSSIRVDTTKLDRLVNLVGELVISVAQVNQKARDPNSTHDARVTAVEALEQISRDLQEQVMSLRMVPVQETFDRFKRAIRDLSAELGKFVVLETSGTETELDKNVIEQLVDPLKHMIRNSVSHGIESPKDRVAAGKSDTGRLHLRAAQREGHIIIEVIDDGKGIDSEAVLRKGQEKGLVAPGKVLSQREIYGLIFEPGFSTAKEINEISGRGVGLDVVRRNIEALRGSVEVDSEFGKGTTFRIRLPLTLAIIDGMNVKVGGETVTIPLLSVVELMEPSKEVIKTIEGKGEIVDVRGELLPMLRLDEVFDFGINKESNREAKVVIVEDEGRKFGVLVDRVLGMEQAVIKPLDRSFSLFTHLEDEYEKPEGIAGATILGDGTVGLILDVHGIEQMAFGSAQ